MKMAIVRKRQLSVRKLGDSRRFADRIPGTLLAVGLVWLLAVLEAPVAGVASPSAPAAPVVTPSAANPWVNAPGSKEYPGASAIILKDEIEAIVNEDGSHDLIEYDAIKLLDKHAVERFGRTTRVYDTKTESVEVTLARMWSENGQLTVVPASAITDTVPQSFINHPLYQRMHEMAIEYKEAAIGSVVEFRVIHHHREAFHGRRFWEVSYTQDFEPILDTRFTFSRPERMRVNIATPGSQQLQPEQVSRGNARIITRWHLKDRPALVHQTAMPPLRQIATQIQVANFSDWTDFADWATTMWEGVTSPDPAIGAQTASTVRGLDDDDRKTRAIMAWIDKEKQTPTEDVGLDDIPPSPAGSLLRVKTLIPADRAVLMLSMLRAAHIRAWPALVATAEYGDPHRGCPSMQQFNRVLIALPRPGGTFAWIDPVAGTPYVLGQGLSDRAALLLNGGHTFVSTGRAPPEMNREEISGVASLDSDGSMETSLQVNEYGANSMMWREMVAKTTSEKQREMFQLLVSSINPTAVLHDFYVPAADPAHPDAPLQMTVGFEIARGGTRTPSGDGFQFLIPLLQQRRLVSYAEVPVGKRVYPVVLGGTLYEERRLQIVLPPGWTIKSLPRAVARSNSVGSFQVDTRSDDRNIWYYSRLILRRGEIPISDYEQFKALMDQVAETSAEQVVLNVPAHAQR